MKKACFVLLLFIRSVLYGQTDPLLNLPLKYEYNGKEKQEQEFSDGSGDPDGMVAESSINGMEDPDPNKKKVKVNKQPLPVLAILHSTRNIQTVMRKLDEGLNKASHGAHESFTGDATSDGYNAISQMVAEQLKYPNAANAPVTVELPEGFKGIDDAASVTLVDQTFSGEATLVETGKTESNSTSTISYIYEVTVNRTYRVDFHGYGLIDMFRSGHVDVIVTSTEKIAVASPLVPSK